VVSNLIDNAIKYSFDNTEVIIDCIALENNTVKITISNKGEMIDSASLEKIFDRFFRVESSRNRNLGGAGLGLSVVKSIISLHNGSITVESSSEGITKFIILL
jgi:signal transduction histidine kinase